MQSKQSKHYFNFPIEGNYEQTEDGGLIVRNVIAMAPGDWTSMQGIRTLFSAEVLKKCADNWSELGVWTRHPGGGPRNVTEKVGIVQNPRYGAFEDREGALVDMYLHGATSLSKDAIGQVQLPPEKGGIKSVSAETMLDIDPNGNVQNITFTGLAIVDIGACETCKIPAYSAGEGGKNMAEEDTSASGGGTETAETLVSVARDIFRANGLDDVAELFDMAVNLEGNKDALDQIMAKLKEKVKSGEGTPEDVPDMAEIMEPFSKKMDEILAFAKKADEKNAAFEKSIVDVKTQVEAFAKAPNPQLSKYGGGDLGASAVVTYEENAPAVFRGRKK